MVFIPEKPKKIRKARKSKYGNKRVQYMGRMFDSIGERDRYIFLKSLEAAGEIRNLRCQVRFKIEFNGVHICEYIADFVYDRVYMTRSATIGVPMFSDGEISERLAPRDWQKTVVEDFKGVKTEVFKLKEKMMKACHDIDIHVVKSPTSSI